MAPVEGQAGGPTLRRVPQDVTVANADGHVVGATPIFSGGKRSLPLKLSPGTYTFYCSVPAIAWLG